MRTHAAGDFCLVGPSGSGKSIIVKKFAEILNYEVEPVILYQVGDLCRSGGVIGFVLFDHLVLTYSRI